VVGLVVFAGVGELAVDLGEAVTDALAELAAGLGGLEALVADVLEVEVVDEEARGHDVVLVDEPHEALDAGLLDELLLVEGALGRDEAAGDAGDEQVRELVALRGGGSTLLPVS
jgi:hypothetical protein